MDYTCCVSVKHTCIDMGDYLRERLYLEGVRRGTTDLKSKKLDIKKLDSQQKV